MQKQLLGFVVSAVVIPILAIYGHAKLQGTMLDFGKKVSPAFALIYSVIVYAISVALPKRWASKTIFRAVTLVTFVFSIPDFLQFFISESILTAINENIPLSQYSMGWVLPAFVVFVIANFLSLRKNYSEG